MANTRNQDFARRLQKQDRILLEMFKEYSSLDSAVLFEIPNSELSPEKYRFWLVRQVETPWILEGINPNYCTRPVWNEADGINGKFGRFALRCKLYRYDGTIEPTCAEDYRAKKGMLLRDHYSEIDVSKIQVIADNFRDYLISHGIEFARFNFDRATRNLLKA